MSRLVLGLGLGPPWLKAQAPPPVLNPPVNSVAPAITSDTGFTEVAAVLTATNGTWTNSPTGYSYQWRRDGVNISGATNQTYTLVTADVGTSILCRVTASNADGDGMANSNALSPVLARRMTPSDIAGITAWYNPNDPAGLIEAGGFASQLTDLSGNGKHLLQATGANQLAVVTVGGKKVLSASGSGQWMSTAVYTALQNNVGYFFGIVVALANAGATAGRLLVSANTSGADTAAGAIRFQRNGTNAQISMYAGSGTSTWVTTSTPYDTAFILTIQRNQGTLLDTTKNGAAVVSGVGDASALAWTRHAIFVNLTSSGNVGTTYGAGTMGPIAFYNATLSAGDRQKVEGILAWLSGKQADLDPSHPYLLDPPRI